ncbi:M48 family metallopeptidase [Bradyrhizobium oligotrophicum S58]
MTVGLPLLMILDERAIRAVIAHEVAHAELRHISGGANLLDFLLASENVLHYADPDRTVTGRIAELLLRSLLDWIDREYRALSRQHELDADKRAAVLMGNAEMARALVLVAGAKARLRELVYSPLETEMLGAVNVPATPLQRMCAHIADIRAPERIVAAAAATLSGEKEDDIATSTHPPLSRRLANLGYAAVPALDSVQTSAIERLLAPDAISDLSARLDAEWRKGHRHGSMWGCDRNLARRCRPPRRPTRTRDNEPLLALALTGSFVLSGTSCASVLATSKVLCSGGCGGGRNSGG